MFLQASSFSISTSIGVIIIIVLYALDDTAVFNDTVKLLRASFTVLTVEVSILDGRKWATVYGKRRWRQV